MQTIYIVTAIDGNYFCISGVYQHQTDAIVAAEQMRQTNPTFVVSVVPYPVQ